MEKLKTDLHVLHFRNPLPLGGDTEASLSIEELVGWLKDFAPVGTRVVIGCQETVRRAFGFGNEKRATGQLLE